MKKRRVILQRIAFVQTVFLVLLLGFVFYLLQFLHPVAVTLTPASTSSVEVTLPTANSMPVINTKLPPAHDPKTTVQFHKI